MSLFAKIPATVVTGFLGAGKTTLVHHLLSQANGRKIALIINEFGDVGVDGQLLASCSAPGCTDDDIIELTNGCLCCTVADEFLPAMERLLARPQPPEHIIIETSGLALPKPLVKAFEWPDIRARVTVDGVIVVVDGPALASGRFTSSPEQKAKPDHDNPLEEVFDDQLACADMVLLNKADQMTDQDLALLQSGLAGKLRTGVKLLATRHGHIDARVALGLDAAAEDDLDARPTWHDTQTDHHHDDFESFCVALPSLSDPAAILTGLAGVIERHDILRLKGFVDVKGKAMRHVLQAVGSRISGYYDRPWKADEARTGQVVVIGLKGMDQDAIGRDIAAVLA